MFDSVRFRSTLISGGFLAVLRFVVSVEEHVYLELSMSTQRTNFVSIFVVSATHAYE